MLKYKKINGSFQWTCVYRHQLYYVITEGKQHVISPNILLTNINSALFNQ